MAALVSLTAFFFSQDTPFSYKASINASFTESTVNLLLLSRIVLITHLTANVYRLRSFIGAGTPYKLTPSRRGNNNMLGVIFTIQAKNIQKGSILSVVFKEYLKSHRKLNAHNFLPRRINAPKNKL